MNCFKCATPLPEGSKFCLSCGTDVSGEDHRISDTIAMPGDPELQAKLQAELGDEYIIERELGRGGMAVVYLGHDSRLGRKVAVKVLPPELTFGGSTVERFKREAQTAAKLDHPNIIPVYRVAPGGKLFWYVMKFLDGEGLDHVLEREGQLTVERTVEVVSQMASALDYAHQNHVIHRDIKPANAIVDKRGWVTVTDFGIAKALDANTLTASGSIIGTPYYMSPEQCMGKRVGAAADQYSLAVMTYQMLGGHVPFTGDSAIEIVHKHVADPVPPLGVLRPELPARVVEVVERGLSKAAEERYATVQEFAKALKAAAEGVDFAAAPPKKPAPVRMSKTALVSPVPGALRSAKGEVKSRKGLWIGGSIAGVAVVAGVVGLLVVPRLTQQPAQEPAAPAGKQPPTTVQPPTQGRPEPSTPTATAPVTQSPASAADTRTAHFIFQGAPAGAAIAIDGRRVSGLRPPVEGGRPHQITVTATGYETWNQALSVSPGEEMRVTVTMRPAAAQPAVTGAQQAAPTMAQPSGAQPAPTTSQPAPVADAEGSLWVATNPPSLIYVNGQSAGRSPLRNHRLAAGTYTLTFTVVDSTGQMWQGTPRTVTITSGAATRIPTIQLVRP